MELAVFAKKRTNKEGKTFFSYLSRLKRKDGFEIPVSVSFRQECGQPKAERCPMNIVVDKKNANLASNEYLDPTTGEIKISYTLWVSAWRQGKDFVDTSLDDFE